MSRRTITLLVAGGLLVVLFAVAWFLPVPYVAMSPGPTANVLGKADGKPVVEIEKGTRTYATDGELDLTTVAVTGPAQRLDLLSALGDWLASDVAVVPRSYLYGDEDTPEEIERQNVQQMETSQHDAVAAALAAVDIDVPVVNAMVYELVDGSPAVGKLELGDVLVAVDGTEVTDAEHVVELIGSHKPGDKIKLDVTRDGEPTTVTVTTAAHPDDPKRAFVGFEPRPGYDFPFDVTINIDQNIGGPSAGLMFAVAIVDKLTPGALTGGEHIAGTGTIDGAGEVGGIGGIQQKIAAAKAAGASVFLTPEPNCPMAAAAGVEDIRLVRVATLDDAVEALGALRDGDVGSVPSCDG